MEERIKPNRFACDAFENVEEMSEWLNDLNENHSRVEIKKFTDSGLEGDDAPYTIIAEVWD